MVAAALAALALLLVLARRQEDPPTPAPPDPVPADVPATFSVVHGRLDGTRAAERTILAFATAVEVVLREESLMDARRRGETLVLDLAAGRLFLDAGTPDADVRIRTPHAEVLARGACVDVRSSPDGTAVTVGHGAVTVVGTPFRQEIARDEAVDVSPTGSLGKPLRIDPAAALRWAAEAVERASRLRHGSFEEGFGDGRPGGGPGASVRLDRRAHAGRQCVLIELNSAREVRHEGPLSGPVELPPGARVRFRGYVQHQDLDGGPDGGFYLDVRDASGASLARTPIYRGVSGWRKFAVEFTAPALGGPFRVAGRMVENGAAQQGRIRVDDLALFAPTDAP